MNLIPISFIAGILTVLSPCVFTLLPVILGGAVENVRKRNPTIIILSLVLSIFLFTLLLKTTTLFIMVHPLVWSTIAGGLLILFGISSLFPDIWGRIDLLFGFTSKSDKALHTASSRHDFIGDVMIGVALGPVFSSCSPTYSLIIATILPQNFFVGLINLIVYVAGLGIILLLTALFGQKIVKRLKWAVDPKGAFKRGMAIFFIVLGILIIFGVDKQIETYFVTNGIFDITQFERNLIPPAK